MVLIGKHVKLLIDKQKAGMSNIDCNVPYRVLNRT